MAASGRERLDVVLAARELVRSRSEARDLILRGAVTAGGRVAGKPGELVDPASEIAIAAGASGYVSRGALKLEAALDGFAVEPSGLIALDLGASTGGFTDLLLERGARKVYAVDVGHDQLAERLRADPRVVSLEGQDGRGLTRELIPEPPDLIVADVSFISLRLALPAALDLAAPGAVLIALVKPQFELGPDALGKNGVVRDEAAAAGAATAIADWLAAQPGWSVTGSMPSPLPGKEGNQEYLISARLVGAARGRPRPTSPLHEGGL